MLPEITPTDLKEIIRFQQERIKFKYPQVWAATGSIVKIVSYVDGYLDSHGSGVVVDGGAILTEFHVIAEAEKIQLCANVAGRPLTEYYSGVIVRDKSDDNKKNDEKLDVAMLSLPVAWEKQVPARPIAPTQFADQELFLLGFPWLHPDLEWPLVGQAPIMQATRLRFKTPRILSTMTRDGVSRNLDGASGGALVNTDGAVVGILDSSRDWKGGNSLYAVPIETVMSTLKPS